MAYPDRPDLKTQIALNKVLGITPTLTPAEQRLFAEQQWLESEQKRMAQEKGLPRVLGGDVRSYTGSMFAPAGSPMAAVPIPQGAPRVGEASGGIDVNAYRGSMFGEGVMGAAPVLGSRNQPYNPNVSADVILGQRFGQRPVGQVSYAPSAPQTFTQGQQTPRGNIVGAGESLTIGDRQRMAPPVQMAPQMSPAPILGQNYQGVPDMTGGYEQAAPSPISRPSMATAAPIQQEQRIQPSVLGGTPVPMPQQAPVMAPILGAYQPGSQAYNYFQQQGVSPQVMGYAEQAAAGSPYMQQLGMQKQQFAATQQERQIKSLLDRAANDFAAGNANAISQLPPELRTQAYNAGLEIRKKLSEKEPKVGFQEQALAAEIARMQAAQGGRPLTPEQKSQAFSAVLSAGKPTPEEQARAVGLTEEAKSDAAFINDIQSNALESGDVMDSNKEVKRLLTSGLTTGTGEQFKTNALALLKSIGVNVDSSRVGDRQYLISLLGQDALAQAKKFYAKQGSVTESERKRIDTIALSMDKDTSAVLQMIALRDAAAQRAIDANKYISSLKEENPKISKSQLAEAARNWYAENRMSKFIEATQKAQLGASKQEIRTDKSGRRWTKDANGNVVEAR